VALCQDERSIRSERELLLERKVKKKQRATSNEGRRSSRSARSSMMKKGGKHPKSDWDGVRRKKKKISQGEVKKR